MITTLTEEQAAMWRWARRHMVIEQAVALTGKSMTDLQDLSVIGFDCALRNAFAAEMAMNAAQDCVARSKIKSGILPEQLGLAIVDFAEAARSNDDLKFRDAFLCLVEAIANIPR